MRSKLTLLCLMFLCTLNAVAQQLNVTGNVKDALGEYIIGASVLVKEPPMEQLLTLMETSL